MQRLGRIREEHEAEVVVQVRRLDATSGNLVNVDVVDSGQRRDEVRQT